MTLYTIHFYKIVQTWAFELGKPCLTEAEYEIAWYNYRIMAEVLN